MRLPIGIKRVVSCGIAVLLLAALSPPTRVTADDAWVKPGQVATLIPSDDEVTMFYGMPMTPDGPPWNRPTEPFRLAARDDCRDFVDLGSTRAWGDDYASFRAQVWNNTGRQARAGVVVGTYATAADAHALFDRTFNQAAVDRCRDAHLVPDDAEPGVTLDLVYISFDPNGICSWLLTERHYGRNVGYTSASIALASENFRMAVASNQWGNAGDTMNRLSDHVLDRLVPE